MKKIFVKNKRGEKLVGFKMSSKNDENVCLLVHGFGADKYDWGLLTQIGKFLNKYNITAYSFDFSGCGESDGSFETTTLTKEKDDLKAIINYIRSKKPHKFFIIAQSFGTSVTIATNPKTDLTILMGSLANPKKVIAEIFGKDYNPNGISSRKRRNDSITKIGPRFWKDLDKYDLSKIVKKLNFPVVFIHGDKDDRVPIENSKLLFKNTGKLKSIEIIKGADHGYWKHRKELLKIIKKHLTKNKLIQNEAS